VYNRLSGTVTWLPKVGQVIKPGQTLFEIDGQPVILMRGSTPAYRDLTAADSAGADIEQLNRNLVRLGFNANGVVVDGEWQPATTLGVQLLQESLGEAETGNLALGGVVFLRGDQVVSSLDAAVGSTGAGGSGGSAASASTAVVAPESQFVGLRRVVVSSSSSWSTSASTSQTTSATTTPGPSSVTTRTESTTTKPGSDSTPRTSTSSPTLTGLTRLLKAEAEQLKAATAALKAAKAASSRSAHSSSSSSGSSSSGAGSGSAILQTTSTQLVVTVDLSASSQSEAKVGEGVTVELPAGSRVAGRIIAVSRVAQTASSSDANSPAGASGSGSGGGGAGSSASSSTVPVTIKLKRDRSGNGLDQAAVSVSFAQARARHVLSVPVTALVATAGGTFALQEADSPFALLPVTTGLFAAGYVQISGPGIHPGLQVTDSQG
ncbi:MAG TPA: hypothetical protein VIJ60_02590, partial [Acidimicrobiales bacterium]